MPRLTQFATFTHSSITSPCTVPYSGFHEIIDWVPGRPHTGKPQGEAPRPAGRFIRINGLLFELRGQSGSATEFPESDLLKAAGMVRSGSTGYTYALGDIHTNGGTPSGDTVLVPTGALNIDGINYPLANMATDVMFDFTADMIPTLSVDLLGRIADADADSTHSTLGASAVPTVTEGPLPMPWINNAITITPSGGAALVNGLVKQLSTGTGNRISPRKAPAGFEFGYADFGIVNRGPAGSLTLEFPEESALALEDIVRSRTKCSLQWVYLAGGATFNTWTFTQTVYFTEQPSRVDLDGFLGYSVPFVQDYSVGPLTMACSTT